MASQKGAGEMKEGREGNAPEKPKDRHTNGQTDMDRQNRNKKTDGQAD